MLEEKISQDYIQAMKSKDALKSSTLNFLRAQLKNVRIDNRLERLEDLDVISVIKKQIKQRQDSIEQYKMGGRQDLVDKETQELEILKTYLPKELSEPELQSIVINVIKENQATSIKDMGKVMKIVLEKTAGCADNKVVSDIVKKNLSGL